MLSRCFRTEFYTRKPTRLRHTGKFTKTRSILHIYDTITQHNTRYENTKVQIEMSSIHIFEDFYHYFVQRFFEKQGFKDIKYGISSKLVYPKISTEK